MPCLCLAEPARVLAGFQSAPHESSYAAAFELVVFVDWLAGRFVVIAAVAAADSMLPVGGFRFVLSNFH